MYKLNIAGRLAADTVQGAQRLFLGPSFSPKICAQIKQTKTVTVKQNETVQKRIT